MSPNRLNYIVYNQGLLHMKSNNFRDALDCFESIDLENIRMKKWTIYLRMAECCINLFNKERYESESSDNIFQKKVYEGTKRSYYLLQR